MNAGDFQRDSDTPGTDSEAEVFSSSNDEMERNRGESEGKKKLTDKIPRSRKELLEDYPRVALFAAFLIRHSYALQLVTITVCIYTSHAVTVCMSLGVGSHLSFLALFCPSSIRNYCLGGSFSETHRQE